MSFPGQTRDGPPIGIAYWGQPDQIIWIDLPPGHRRLSGFDNYWVDWPRYGMFQDDENMGTMYTGFQHVAWEYVGWTAERGHIEVEIDPTPPPGVEIYRGFMLTQSQAEFVGIL